jgi:hypothetical protein
MHRLIVSILLVILLTLFTVPALAGVNCARKPSHPQCQTQPTPTPTPTLTPVPTATPQPVDCDHYIAPGGSDSAAGTMAAPWRTILYGSAQLTVGEVLCARGGTYTGQGGYNWKSSGTSIRAYPSETPVFDGAGWSHGIIVSGYSNVTIDGLTFTGYGMGPSGDGAILLLNASDITIVNSRFLNNGIGFQQDHHIYINSGCADIVIRNNVMDTTPGAAVHIYHDPGPTNVLIEDNQMRNGYWGVVVGSNANGVAMNGNTYSENVVNMDNQRGTNVTASGNSPNDVIQ